MIYIFIIECYKMIGHPDFLFELGRCVLTSYTDNDQIPEIPFDTVDLMFKNCRLSRLPTLNNNLQILRFDNCNNEMITVPAFLPRLCQISIWNCPNFENLPRNINGFNNISIISIEDCPKLINIQSELLDRINILFLKNTGISHIPSINVKTLMLFNNQKLTKIDYLPNIENIYVSSNEFDYYKNIIYNINIKSLKINNKFN